MNIGVTTRIAILALVAATGVAAPADESTVPAESGPTSAPAPADTTTVPSADDQSGAVQAVWVEKDITFTYMAFTSYYSCNGLRDKLTWILEQVGAAPGSRVSMRGCSNLNGPERMPRAFLEIAVPRRATPELIEQLAKDASKRELVARTRGERSVINDPEAQFAAKPKRVAFSDTPLSRIESGDCELMEQLRDHVFAPLGLRIVKDQIHCVPHSVRPGTINLEVEVLEPWKLESEPGAKADPAAAQ